MTVCVCGATRSAAPVGNRVGNAQEMYPSVLNSLMGVALVGGYMTVGGVPLGWSLCPALTV